MKDETNTEPAPAQGPLKKPKPRELFYRMDPEDVDYATDIRASILAQSPRGGRAIVWAVLILLCGAVYWASVSEIEEVTRGEGKVIPSGQIQVVQNLEGGIISEILIRAGDTVERGQLLLRIDETRFSSSFQQSRARYLANLAKAARLQAEATGTAFIVPPEVMAESPEIGNSEKQLYDSRQNELRFAVSIRQEQLNQRRSELRELQVKLEELNRTYDLFEKELALLRPLVAKGAVSEMEVLQNERRASEMRGEMEVIRQSIPRARSRIEESTSAIQEIRLNFVNKAKADLNDVQSLLGEETAAATALRDRLDRTLVRSPVNGIVNRVLVSTLGGVVQPGMDLIEIVPAEGTLLIEARIRPSDIAFLRPAQKAMIKITAYDFTIFGGLEAKLEHIGADSITDEKGNSYYLVQLRTERNYLGTENNPLPIIPGMVATADILTGKRTVLSYLMKPILRAKYTAFRER
ncbi:membrane fusion protein, adhesin transport system [Desulfonatronum thiosulfatophilum]|uniref:Membrane fusion protein, adhesin transport system n=1 Tax=Desulfonatronum thiosulfatophilum TaxID=617002 RepID=A0A1G6CMC6_9BACT|nr:HlyD family type I secretion periplasmic adaptor subunit [Desulfonatronum thiosulfatophilum]SDB34038.1 membrane fusion protein, adhesin transport system [Desulfonatronum thiosulfatophilum]